MLCFRFSLGIRLQLLCNRFKLSTNRGSGFSTNRGSGFVNRVGGEFKPAAVHELIWSWADRQHKCDSSLESSQRPPDGIILRFSSFALEILENGPETSRVNL